MSNLKWNKQHQKFLEENLHLDDLQLADL